MQKLILPSKGQSFYRYAVIQYADYDFGISAVSDTNGFPVRACKGVRACHCICLSQGERASATRRGVTLPPFLADDFTPHEEVTGAHILHAVIVNP